MHYTYYFDVYIYLYYSAFWYICRQSIFAYNKLYIYQTQELQWSMAYSANMNDTYLYTTGYNAERLTSKIHDFSRRLSIPVDTYGRVGWKAGRKWTRGYNDVKARNTDRLSEYGHRKTFNLKLKLTEMTLDDPELQSTLRNNVHIIVFGKISHAKYNANAQRARAAHESKRRFGQTTSRPGRSGTVRPWSVRTSSTRVPRRRTGWGGRRFAEADRVASHLCGSSSSGPTRGRWRGWERSEVHRLRYNNMDNGRGIG